MEAVALFDRHRLGSPFLFRLCRDARSGDPGAKIAALRALGCIWPVVHLDTEADEAIFLALRSPMADVRLAAACAAKGPASIGASTEKFQSALFSMLDSPSIPLLQAVIEALRHAAVALESPLILERLRSAARVNPKLRYLMETESGALAAAL